MIETGIYTHFKEGHLYFVDAIDIDTEKEEVSYRVHYWALYPLPQDFKSFTRSLGNFQQMMNGPTEMVPRFKLLRRLDRKYLDILLPGTVVSGIIDNGWKKFTVNRLFQYGEDLIRVELKEEGRSSLTVVPFDTYLNNFIPGSR